MVLSGCERDEERVTGYGTMNIRLSANSSVIEVGASSNTRSDTAKTNSDSVVITRAEAIVPEAGDFALALYKEKLVVKQWERFSEFGQEEKIAVGQYVLKATYGDLETEGLDKPYFEGSTSLAIREREATTAEIICYLANVKVSIVCTDAVKKYFKSFSMQMRSDVGKLINISKDETLPIYLKPGLLVLNAQLEKQNGKSSKIELLRLSDTEARQHYTITVDVNGGETGGGTLNVTYNSTKSEEDVSIDLSDASLNIKEPVFTAQGFENGETRTLREGSEPSAMKVTLNARAGIRTCELIVHAPYLMKKLGFAENVTVDLASKDPKYLDIKRQLEDNGLRLIGLNENLEKLALIDFTPLIMGLLCTGDADENSTFTLRATDTGGRVEEKELVLNVLMQSNQFSFPEIEDVVMIGSTEAGVKIRLLANEENTNGKIDVENVIFEYQDEAGQWIRTKTVWDGDDWDDEVLHYAIIENLPEVHTKLKIRARYGSKESQVQTLNYFIPQFSLTADEVDIWPRKATIKVEAKTDEERDAVLKYFKLINDDVEMENVTQSGNAFLCEKLAPGITYNLKGVCNGDASAIASYPLTTEKALQLPNSNFEQWDNGAYDGKSINKGGAWAKRVNGFDFSGYTAKKTYESTSLTVQEPTSWACVNLKTMPSNPKDVNTWYVVASTNKVEDKIKGQSVLLRNVGWNNNAEIEIGTYGQAGNFIPKENCYSAFPGFAKMNTPPNTLNYSAGRLFLGTYSYDHSTGAEIYNQGYDFHSRPLAFRFQYKYTSITRGAEDKAYVEIVLKNGTDIIAKEYSELIPTNNISTKEIQFNYLYTDKKVNTICVMFCSSIEGKELQQSIENESIRNKPDTDPVNKEQACSTGSELYIDNVELIY